MSGRPKHKKVLEENKKLQWKIHGCKAKGRKPMCVLPQVHMCDSLGAEFLQDPGDGQMQRVFGSEQHAATVRQESADEATLT